MPDPSSIIKWILPFSLMITIIVYTGEILGTGYTILAAFASLILGKLLSIWITEIQVDHKKLVRETRDCDRCGGSGDYGYMQPQYCTQCGGSGTEHRAFNTNRDCDICDSSGIMKRGKISRTTCSCVIKNWEKSHKERNKIK